MNRPMEEAVALLDPGPLTEQGIEQHIRPLFSRVLANGNIYLANHSLGRPLNQMAADVAEATALWETKLGAAWDGWLAEREAFRSRISKLIGSPRADCIVPKISAGQGLRTALNTLPGRPRVLSTRGEFDSVDMVLKQYAALGRIEMRWVAPDEDGRFHVKQLMAALDEKTDLVVVSQVMFMTGQVVHQLGQLADACHSAGARLLVDSYHAIGVFPVDVSAMKADFLIGGSYKYLRGGAGACFLYISPEALASGLRPLDTGWFAKPEAFAYERPEPPVLRAGGDAFLEATPPVLTWYQARSGQQFALRMGVARLREYGLKQLRSLKRYLASENINALGADADHGAFLAIRAQNASAIADDLARAGVIADARGAWLRLCPDCLTSDGEMQRAAALLGRTAS